jgi:hypothetical protein
MYCPSLKKNVEAIITDGKRVASKGGSLRNIIYGEYEGRKCLPKTVKAEIFAQHGFAAESKGESATYEPSQEPEGSTPATEPTNANFEAEKSTCRCGKDIANREQKGAVVWRQKPLVLMNTGIAKYVNHHTMKASSAIRKMKNKP